jgi:hypothetical protein
MRVYNMWRRATGASHLSQAAAADLTQGPSSRNLQTTSHQTQTLLHSITFSLRRSLSDDPLIKSRAHILMFNFTLKQLNEIQ